jgi:hypothetical protein
MRFGVGIADGRLAQKGKLPLKVLDFGPAKGLVGHRGRILPLLATSEHKTNINDVNRLFSIQIKIENIFVCVEKTGCAAYLEIALDILPASPRHS